MKKICYVISVAVFMLACTPKDDINVIYEPGTNPYINQWIYDQMDRYYYWNYTLPKQSRTNLDLEPQVYFKSLLYTADRFSFTYHPDLGETYSQSLRKSFGFDMNLITHEGETFAIVLYSLSSSPATDAGLSRGVLITAINGEKITTSNYKTLYNGLITLDEATLTITQYTKVSGFTTSEEVQINQSFTLNPPINEVVLHVNNRNIGYLNVPYFEVGMAKGFVSVFNKLKQQNINALVLDLRYNGGGDVSSAAALSIILGQAITANDLFITFEGNKNGGIIDQTFQEALETNESKVSFDELREVHPQIGTLYVLCGERTASASEIIINNLRPYIHVVTIGETTYGKNFASFTVQDDRDTQNPGWILSPAIYALYNADGSGDYQNGLQPDYILNELENLEVYPLGNTNELLLKKALELMN